ncbi:MAG: polysaccharide pyruvyl transferase family protein [Eubacterium sp.]
MDNKNIKIGIVTHYYKSSNYGGNLQAYALCKYLNRLGYTAEQICFPLSSQNIVVETIDKNDLPFIDKLKLIKTKFNIFIYNLITIFKRYNARKKILLRKKCIEDFNSFIPHSEFLCENNDFSSALNKYDIFITGSDQVWNPIGYNPIYFLDFVPSNKPKISYAASIAQSKLNEYQEDLFKKHLSDFIAISVREQASVKLLSKLSPVDVKWVIDPTLLLSQQDWEEICADKHFNEPYIFCYFLGSDPSGRTAAKKFAAKKNLKIATLPYLQGKYRQIDDNFGDYKLYDISPKDFISLIKYAEYIFTDSFHAIAFSEIYKKEYFIFHRFEAKEMASRIYDLTELFNHSDRFLNTPEKSCYEYISKLPKMNYIKSNKFEKLKQQSIEYLINCLKISEELIDESKA